MVVSTIPIYHGRIGTVEFSSFTRQVLGGRWFSLFASFLVMTSAGAFYLYSHFSKDIKETLQCDQTTLNKIGFYKDIGSNIDIFSVLLVEISPSWVLLVICSAVNFIGYFKIWQGVVGQIVQPSVEYFCFYIAMGGNSQILANSVVLVTCVRNFPERRGVILGLLKGFLGLGAAVLSQIYLAIYGHDTKSLILFIAWFPSLITLIFAFSIKEVKIVKHPHEFRVFIQFLCITLILAMFIIVLTIIQRIVQFDQSAHIIVMIAIMGLLILPLFIAIREEMVHWNLNKMTKFEKCQTSASIISYSSSTLQHSRNSDLSNIFNKPERGDDYTILQGFFSIDMLLICLTMSIGIGSSLTAMDNLGQIGESQGYSAESINAIVTIISIFNFLGRIFSGFVSEILLEQYKFPRPLMLTLTLLVSCIGYLLVAFPFNNSLYIASILIGFAFGSQVLLDITVISEIFGLKHYAIFYNIAQLSCPIGTYVLNVLVAGKLYDKEVKTWIDSSEYKCHGEQCYKDSFTILTGMSLLGAAISLILVKRTREFYRGDIYRKFREDMDSLREEVELYSLDVRQKEDESVHVHKEVTIFKK
ncbi:Protein NUCLEAR FUSION DEFECTIVE 4, partial [Cucurbita argyrosperma subsp. sororia]